MKANGHDKGITQTETSTDGKPNAATAYREGVDDGVMAQVQGSGREIAAKSVRAIEAKTRATTAGYQSDISSGLHTLAEGLRQTSSTFREVAEDKPISAAGARYVEGLAEKIDDVSAYLERTQATELILDVRRFARRNPTVFAGGAFALGFVLSRLVRTAAARQAQG